MSHCWTFNIEDDLPSDFSRKKFDVLIFSHVLEHLRDPVSVLSKFSGLLDKNGQILIAVPNILSWRMRLQFLLGRFEYESGGVLDDTHLRFFTYDTADKYLLAKSLELKLTDKRADGSVPLWFLRRYNILPHAWCKKIDNWGCRLLPNLFGGQVLLKLEKL
jgi:2-polyprenyl-3-methyl-5-hydroxy-6-metoxy-1,4-benzoquinol methylase